MQAASPVGVPGQQPAAASPKAAPAAAPTAGSSEAAIDPNMLQNLITQLQAPQQQAQVRATKHRQCCTNKQYMSQMGAVSCVSMMDCEVLYVSVAGKQTIGGPGSRCAQGYLPGSV